MQWLCAKDLKISLYCQRWSKDHWYMIASLYIWKYLIQYPNCKLLNKLLNHGLFAETINQPYVKDGKSVDEI